MAEETHTIESSVSIDESWAFIKDMNNWAPLVPGYTGHEIINELQSTWEFKADLGFMKKPITLQVDIKEWIEPTRVIFDLKGISDNFTGGGYFEATPISDVSTQLTGHLDIKAGGMMAAMVNPVLKDFVPHLVRGLTTEMGIKMAEING